MKREEEIRARLENITQNDWAWTDGAKVINGRYDWVPQGSYLGETLITMGDTYENGENDADFIAHSPSDIDYLLRDNKFKATLLEDAEAQANDLLKENQRLRESIKWFERQLGSQVSLYGDMTANRILEAWDARQALEGKE